MKNVKLKTMCAALLCVPMCGAWTAAQAETPADAAEIYYGGAVGITAYATENIYYTSRTVTEDIQTARGCPLYTTTGGMSNECGAVAGSIVVGFYDAYYSELISGWASNIGSMKYKSQDNTYIPALQKTLYTDMRTNVTQAGVTQANFKSGLQTYINGKGYTVSYSELGGSSFNYSAFKTAVGNNKVSVLFVNSSNFYTLTAQSGYDTITTTSITKNHIMVAYGYEEIKYTLTNGSTRTDAYLKVSTGFDSNTDALYKVGSYVTASCVVNIG